MSKHIFAFPFAGGNKYSFNNIKQNLESGTGFKVLEYPGRGKRMNEDLLTNINEIVEDALVQFKSENNSTDFIFYGHSMGGLVAYLLCKKIEEQGLAKPLKLVVTGSNAPSQREDDGIHKLPSKDFWEKINEFGGLPKELLQDETLKIFFEPILKADFQVIETYNYEEAANLSIPIDVFWGSDENISKDNVNNWQKESKEPVFLKEMAGDHFFIFNHAAFLGKHLSRQFNYNTHV